MNKQCMDEMHSIRDVLTLIVIFNLALAHHLKAILFSTSNKNPTSNSGEVSLILWSNIEIYNWDGQTVLDCFKLDTTYNMRYAVKYPFFARILTPIGAQTPLIYKYTWLAYILLQPRTRKIEKGLS
jgi:hypothetical protein